MPVDLRDGERTDELRLLRVIHGGLLLEFDLAVDFVPQGRATIAKRETPTASEGADVEALVELVDHGMRRRVDRGQCFA